jgi:hypothetical protein
MKTIFDYKEFEAANRGLGQVGRSAELFLAHMVNKVTTIGTPTHNRLMRVEVKEMPDDLQTGGM